MTPPRGAFFSFEGIDGSGKSTQAHLLVEALRSRGHRVIQVREPGGTPLGERVRDVLLDPEAVIGPRAEVLLFSAARSQLVEDVIEPALRRGDIVVADRYVDSTTAYQGGGRGLPVEVLGPIQQFASHDLQPDRTYYLNVPGPDADLRRSTRGGADRMEVNDSKFYERISDTYARLASAYPSRILALDGTKPIDSISTLILADATRVVEAP